MESTTWNVGETTITQIVEVEAGDLIQQVIPNATRENISAIEWLRPHFADDAGKLKGLVQAFVVKTPTDCVLIDTCIGNGKDRPAVAEFSNLQTDFLDRLSRAGYSAQDIDIVMCTHLHFDHVGWNTMYVDGKWIPTFINARYLFAEDEFNYWHTHPVAEIDDDHNGFNDSVLPIWQAGLADLIPVNYSISQEISLIPTPGHTPGHVSVLIQSGGECAVITGDAVHHPCQIAHPNWSTTSDTDQSEACISRQALFDRCADGKTLFIGSHFAHPVAGYLRKEAAGFRLIVGNHADARL